jgi:TRAP-type C4-dicarboxylate transport system substrate-binding protein
MALSATAARAEPIVLKFEHFLPSVSNFQQNVAMPWCAAIDKDSGGRLKCQIYPSMQLGGTPRELADQVKSGVADIVWTVPGYTAGRFPISHTLEMPFVVPAGGLSGGLAMWEFYEKYAQKEYSDYKVLAFFSGSGLSTHTVRKPIKGLADFAGVRLRTASRAAANIISSFGATPVSMSPPQVTEAVSKGVIDGALAPWELVPAIKLDEITKYHTELPSNQPSFSTPVLVILMNKDKYNSLPADLKAVIDKNSGRALVELAGKSWDKATDEARAKVIAAKQEVVILSQSEIDKMKKASEGVEKAWIKEMSEKGIDGAKLLAGAREITSKYLGK